MVGATPAVPYTTLLTEPLANWTDNWLLAVMV